MLAKGGMAMLQVYLYTMLVLFVMLPHAILFV